MPALQIWDLPEELYVRLRECAEREHRSVANQTIVAIEEMLSNQNCDREKPRGKKAEYPRSKDTLSQKYGRNPKSFVSQFQTESERKARIEKLEALFSECDRINKLDSEESISSEQIVQWVRESRDCNHGDKNADSGKNTCGDKNVDSDKNTDGNKNTVLDSVEKSEDDRQCMS